MDTITVYHGSRAKFDKFNFDYIGQNGTSEGKGIYFTDNKEIAERYATDGYLYTVELSIKKHLTPNNNLITRSDLIKLFKHLHSLDNDYLSNFGEVAWDGLDNVIDLAVDCTYDHGDDVEMVAGLAYGLGSSEDVNRAVYDALGYDSIICKDAEWGNQSIYIALVTDIITIKSCEKQ